MASRARHPGLDFREDVVQVVQRFDVGVHGLAGIPPSGHRVDLEPLGVALLRVKSDLVRNDKNRGTRTLFGVQAHAPYAAGHHEANVGIFQIRWREAFEAPRLAPGRTSSRC